MTENEACQRAVLKSLSDAGCDASTIEAFRALGEQGRTFDQIRLLGTQRARLLENLHDAQQRLDCLDYLLFKLKDSCGCCKCAPRKRKPEGDTPDKGGQNS